jgi:cytoskeletal protein CcmA (bactofilin family)
MALFSKAETQQKSRDRQIQAVRALPIDGAISIIGAGMLVTGDVVTEGVVRVEGEVRGTIRAGKAVILGAGGRVDGDIITEDAVIGGHVSGTIVASNRLELQSTCMVEGEIQAKPQHLKLEEGAQFRGEVRMLDEGMSDLVVTSVSTTSPSVTSEVSRVAESPRVDRYSMVGHAYSDPRIAAQGEEEDEARVVA